MENPKRRMFASDVSRINGVQCSLAGVYESLPKIFSKLQNKKSLVDEETMQHFRLITRYANINADLEQTLCRKVAELGFLNIFERLWQEFWGKNIMKSQPPEKLQSLWSFLDNTKMAKEDLELSVFWLGCRILHQITDNNRSVASDLSKRGMTKKILDKIASTNVLGVGNYFPRDVFTAQSFDDDLLFSLLAILHNTIKNHPDEAAIFREENGIEILSEYLTNVPDDVPEEVLEELLFVYTIGAILFRTLTDDHQDLMETVVFLIDGFVQLLLEAVASEGHVMSWAFPEEILEPLTDVYSVAKVKRILNKREDLLNAVWELIDAPLRPVELASSLKLLFAMSFNEEAKQSILGMKKSGKDWEKLLKRIISCGENLPSDVKIAAEGTLWNLTGEKAKVSKQLQTVTRNEASKKPDNNDRKPSFASQFDGHIMISYDWAHQDIIKPLSQMLKKAGFVIWLDVEQMYGSTLQAMAEAVENSCLVLLCFSEKYFKSPNCQKEAVYADKLHKPIVPIVTQENFTSPTGWLGLILGSKLYTKCCSPQMAIDNFEQVEKQISMTLERANNGSGDSNGRKLSFKPKRPTNQ